MNNELKVVTKQNFMGQDIPVVLGGFGEGKKCISDKTIAEIHNQPDREIRRRITDNIKRFRENVDIIDLKQRVGESHTLEILLNIGYSKQASVLRYKCNNNMNLTSCSAYTRTEALLDNRIYSAFSSLGSIVATIVDIMDGQWDDTMRIKYA